MSPEQRRTSKKEGEEYEKKELEMPKGEKDGAVHCTGKMYPAR